MIEEDREKRIRAAAAALQDRWPRLGILARTVVYRHPSKAEIAGAALDAADRAVPVVSEALYSEACRYSRETLAKERERAERAEAAARDFAKALRFYERALAGEVAASALAAHPDFAEPRA